MIVTITKLDNFGRGITYVNNTICFVENALPNEEVLIEITTKKKKYLEAKVVKYLKTSPLRLKEKCPYTSLCGGCNLAHLSLQAENDYKVAKVKSILEKYANISSDIIEDIIYTDEYHYRNKITLHIANNEIGYYTKKSHQLIKINSCLLASKKINALLPKLQTLTTKNTLTEIIIRTSNDDSQIMVNLIGTISFYEPLIPYVDILYVNDTLVTPKSHLLTTIPPKKYLLSPTSFFQINNTLTEHLYSKILSYIKDKSYQNVLDLYCGVGTISLYINDYVTKVIGIDYSKSNIADANKNKILNKAENISFICSKVEDVITSFTDIDLVIVDPARAGLDSKTINHLLLIKPKAIIYTSCDVITLARDLKELKKTYEVISVTPFNMFPRTYHIENVCLLKLK